MKLLLWQIMTKEQTMNGMVKMLADLFELKIPNPVVDFWFIGKKGMESGEAEKPADFDKYQLLDEKTDADGFVWLCYAKKAVNGVFARHYWHK